MHILVTGKNGQLGSEIHNMSSNYPEHTFLFTGHADLDISNEAAVSSFFENTKIDAVINCAAYTAVDKAEDEIELAEAVNVTGVKNLVNACQKGNQKLIHISTDYVFDGSKNLPYKETDAVSPIGVYGKTKRAGEEVILNTDLNALIIRTSWVYSTFGNNFVKTMLRLGEEKDELNVIYDQVGTPTYARDLANACMAILGKPEKWRKENKIYHFSNEGITSWYDFAIEIMAIASLKCKVNPIETYEYSTKAARPNYSVLNKRQIRTDFGLEVRHWKSALKEFYNKL